MYPWPPLLVGVDKLHFGLEGTGGWLLYIGGIVALLLSIFWRPVVGVYYLVPLLPLQTARYRLLDFPLGQSVVGIILLAVILGLRLKNKQLFQKTPWSKLLRIYAIFTFVSLCLGAIYLGSGFPLPGSPRFQDWLNYMLMPLMLFVVAASVTNKTQMKILVALMCLAVLALDRSTWSVAAGRDFSTFNYDLRDEGGMGYAGVNGLAAFEAQAAIFLLALAAFERNYLVKAAYLSAGVFTSVCLMYSLSRGGYIAFVAGWLFLGFVKDRKLLVLFAAFCMFGISMIPNAVRERVLMTYDQSEGGLDHSSETRVDLWHEAFEVFDSNPIVGAGFYTYAYTSHLRGYKDTHNYFVKVLVETGVVGLAIFLWLLGKSFRVGFSMFRRAQDPFFASVGLGLAGWVVAAAAANFFGDRWTFLQVCGYFWVIAGLVARACIIMSASLEEDAAGENSRAAQDYLQPTALRPANA